MAKSYVHELGDRLSNGSTADNLPSHIKEIAPVMYNDGSNNFNSIQGALNGKAESSHTHTTSIASDSSSGTVVALAHDTQYKLTAGGTSVLFKTPADSNTDTKVTQTKDDSGTTAYPLLMAGATDPNGTATTARYDSGVKLTPSTNTISANISGNAATATSATKATQDSDGNAINATYFKSNAGTTTLQSGAAVKVGTQNGADVKLQLPAIPTATATTPKMDGTAAVGSETTWAKGDHVHPSDTSREAVSNKTTVILGTSDSKYPTDKAVADFVNSSVATNTANYISNDGQPFTSVAQLEAYAGTVTNNDYAFVTGTDSAGNTYYDRYKATVSGPTVTWSLEYRLNNSSFTSAQWAAINSGITSALVGKIHDHANKAVLDGITATDVSNWNGKKDKQTAVTFTGSTLKTPTSMTQDANGELTVTFADIRSASTTQKGVVQLSDSTASASSETAATSAAVKQAYDLAASKQEAITWMTDAEALQLWTDAWDAAT